MNINLILITMATITRRICNRYYETESILRNKRFAAFVLSISMQNMALIDQLLLVSWALCCSTEQTGVSSDIIILQQNVCSLHCHFSFFQPTRATLSLSEPVKHFPGC